MSGFEVASKPCVEPGPAPRRLPGAPAVLAIITGLSLLGLLTWHLSFFWEVNPQYSYGWLVPILAMYLFLRRWKSRPDACSPPRWALFGLVCCLIFLAPIWLVREATPDWSVVTWLIALTIVLAMLLIVGRFGGIRWMIHFAFPVCFILTAVPWPQRLELALVQGLMRIVAQIASEILNWFGIPAVATGNLVHLPSGSVAIDEACSGIRSLQAMVMIALFVGDFWSLTSSRRIVLVMFAGIVAILLNAARTTGLVFIFDRSGMSALEAWHGPAGHAVLAAGMVVLSAAGFLLSWRRRQRVRAVVPETSVQGVRPFSVVTSVAMLVWLAAILSGTELWYRSNESQQKHAVLEIAWPDKLTGYQELPVPDNVRQVLLCSEGRMASWRDDCGWSLFAFNWKAGRTATQSAHMHRPETCFQASGAVLEKELSSVTVAVGPADLFFRAYRFSLNGHPLFVFFTLWEEADPGERLPALGEDWSGWSRVRRAFARQRNLGQQSLEFIISGPSSYEDAVKSFTSRLPRLVQCRTVQ